MRNACRWRQCSWSLKLFRLANSLLVAVRVGGSIDFSFPSLQPSELWSMLVTGYGAFVLQNKKHQLDIQPHSTPPPFSKPVLLPILPASLPPSFPSLPKQTNPHPENSKDRYLAQLVQYVPVPRPTSHVYGVGYLYMYNCV